MMRGHQRADKVQGTLVNGRQVRLRVVALVEDHRDVLDFLGQLLHAGEENLGQAGERRAVGGIAGIGVMQERNLTVGAHQERKTHDPQGGAPLLAMAPLRQRGLLIEGVNEGEVVRGVEEYPAQVEPEVLHSPAHDLRFNGRNRLLGHALHVVPEALAGELACFDVQEPPQHRRLEPLRDSGLASRCQAAVEDGRHQIGSHRGARPLLGYVTIDNTAQIQPTA